MLILLPQWFLLLICNLIHYRYPIAIKTQKSASDQEIGLLLDEAKSMLEIGTYHDNIVNLQGVTYEVNLTEVH